MVEEDGRRREEGYEGLMGKKSGIILSLSGVFTVHRDLNYDTL